MLQSCLNGDGTSHVSAALLAAVLGHCALLTRGPSHTQALRDGPLQSITIVQEVIASPDLNAAPRLTAVETRK